MCRILSLESGKTQKAVNTTDVRNKPISKGELVATCTKWTESSLHINVSEQNYLKKWLKKLLDCLCFCSYFVLFLNWLNLTESSEIFWISFQFCTNSWDIRLQRSQIELWVEGWQHGTCMEISKPQVLQIEQKDQLLFWNLNKQSENWIVRSFWFGGTWGSEIYV